MKKQSNILVIGADGKTGQKVVEGLKRENQKIGLGTRSNDPAFDWYRPDTWFNAFTGIDKVYIPYYSDVKTLLSRAATDFTQHVQTTLQTRVWSPSLPQVI
ncbi:MAG: hypothetical protein AAGD05_09465 [Bacteroidota bacterium]